MKRVEDVKASLSKGELNDADTSILYRIVVTIAETSNVCLGSLSPLQTLSMRSDAVDIDNWPPYSLGLLPTYQSESPLDCYFDVFILNVKI